MRCAIFPNTEAEFRNSPYFQDVRKEAFQEGIEIAIAKEIEKGIEIGKAIARQETAMRCLAKGMPIREIASITQMTIAQLRRLAKKSKH